MSTKGWILFGVICAVLFGGLVYWSQRDKVDVSNVNQDKVIAASEQNGSIGDHVKGNKEAKVVLIEYGDFQCPGCGAVYPRVKMLSEKYNDQVAFVFRNFPLTSIHPNARAAAAAAEAAGLQGKYWQMHDRLFEDQEAWSNASADERSAIFTRYAREIGLDVSQFNGDMQSRSNDINRKISFDQALARKVDVTGTPTFFLNGERLNEEQTGSDETFEKAITDALKEADVALPESSEKSEE